MPFEFFNTESRKIEPLKTRVEGTVDFYSCGPTIYNYVHIGNLRSFIIADVLMRAMEANGNSVKWVMNITDIDDKTIGGTIAKYGESATPAKLREFTKIYADAFFEDLKQVGINSKKIEFVNVSDVITEIQKFILKLLELGYAYKADDGSTYFSISKYQRDFGSYGKLVGDKFIEGTKPGARVSSDEYEKDNVADFALWKSYAANDGDIFWTHPVLGKGRPGWHIECTLINYLKFPLGTDVHSGGVDLIFPHHTNEIAQAEPVYRPFVRSWLHSEHIMIEGKKMSKSLGNQYTLEDVKNKELGDGMSLRFLILQSHYRTKLNVTQESLLAAKTGLENIHSQTKHIAEHMGESYKNSIKGISNEYTEKLRAALDNDLDTSSAIALISEVLKSKLPSKEKLSTISEFEKALGLVLITEEEDIHVPSDVQNLINQRDDARLKKDYAKSDEIRKEIEKFGFEVSDTTSGTKVSKAKK